MPLLVGICFCVSGDFGKRLFFKYPLSDSDDQTTAFSNNNTRAVESGHFKQASQQSTTLGRNENINVVQLSQPSIPPPSSSLNPASLPLSPPTLFQPSSPTLSQPSKPLQHASEHSQNPSTVLLSQPSYVNLAAPEFARLFLPPCAAASTTTPHDVSIDERRFISWPVVVERDGLRSEVLTDYNVILVFDANATVELIQPSSPLYSATPSFTTAALFSHYTRIIEQVSVALAAEQRRCGFVGQQASLIMKCRERYVKQLTERQSRSPTTDSPNQASQVDFIELTRILQSQSLLARHLVEIFEVLQRQEHYYYRMREIGVWDSESVELEKCVALMEPVGVFLNEWLRVELTLSPCAVYMSALKVSMKEMTMPTIEVQPYETVLLLTNPSTLLAALPTDHNSQLSLFVRHLNVCRSLFELSATLYLPVSLSQRLCAHLIYWGWAKVIEPIGFASVFVVRREARQERDRGRYGVKGLINTCLQQHFRQLFDGESLLETLAQFSTPRSLYQHLEQQVKVQAAEKTEDAVELKVEVDFNEASSAQPQRRLLSRIIFLLQHELIQHLQTTYVDISRLLSAPDLSHQVNPLKQSAAALQAIQAADQLFNQLKHYFDGQHTLGRILWLERENTEITRRELLHLLQKQKHRIITINK